MTNDKKRIPLIRFDWAMKNLLRQKANFDVLEGFLSELLKENIKITRILESEGNKEEENDKFNRVDIFVENEKGELLIIEVQNTQEYDYFQRILYGVSKAITEYMREGEEYSKVKKIISITIAYFDLGQGKDYVYHGTTNFVGLHKKDTLNLSIAQRNLYGADTPAELYPEYWLLKIGNFKNLVNDTLDEWLYFFKNAEIMDDFSAKGLSQAKQKLAELKLNDEERIAYRIYRRGLHDRASEEYNKNIESREKIAEALAEAAAEGKADGLAKGKAEGLAEGKAEGKAEGLAEAEAKAAPEREEMILNLQKLGVSIANIATAMNKNVAEIAAIIAKHDQ